jgi:hypothetical protein
MPAADKCRRLLTAFLWLSFDKFFRNLPSGERMLVAVYLVSRSAVTVRQTGIEDVQLLAVYLILAILFFYLPAERAG